jgi:SecD/SecF fusion protein
MLTIIGYSINDSVVVFDRIREFFTERRSTENVGAVINQAINKTLSRTLLTSSTTFFVVLILFIFGGEALKSFSFALLIGIAVGTYSSVFIAAPIVTDVLNRQKGKE